MTGCFHLAQILRDVAEYVMEDNKELAKSISYTMVANITLFVRILMILLHFSLPDITHLFIYDFYNNDDFWLMMITLVIKEIRVQTYIQVEFLRKYCYIEDLDENKACKIVTIVIRGSRASPICGHYKPYPSIYLRSVYIKL